jgi:hypothetical protein
VDLLDRLYVLSATDEDRAGQFILDKLESLLRLGEYAAVDRILQEVNVCKLATSTLLMMLTITFYGKTHLTGSRPDFVARAEGRIRSLLKDDERAERLLVNRR